MSDVNLKKLIMSDEPLSVYLYLYLNDRRGFIYAIVISMRRSLSAHKRHVNVYILSIKKAIQITIVITKDRLYYRIYILIHS